MRQVLKAVLLIAVGVVLGGYLFRDVQPRSFLALAECRDSCYRPSDLAGLLVSAGIQTVPAALPLVLRETDHCITIQHPFPSFQHHLVVFPKRDIRDIASIAAEDGPILMECIEHTCAGSSNATNYRATASRPTAPGCSM
jgi:hypothetical protein